PDGPMSKQAAHKLEVDGALLRPQTEVREQVDDDAIVVARIEGHLGVPPAFGQGAQDVKSLVTVKRRHLDSHDILHFKELPPEFEFQDAAADCRLQVESEHGNNFSDRVAVLEEFSSGG